MSGCAGCDLSNVEVSNRLKKYFERLLNVRNNREGEENCLGMGEVRN